MPKVTCDFCKRRKFVSSSNFKYLDKDGPFVCSFTCLLNWCRKKRDTFLNPTLNGAVLINGNGYSSRGLTVYDIPFRSSYEFKFASFLYDQKIDFKYESLTFAWGGKTYTPDFFLPKYNCLIEVKGLWLGSSRTKYKSFRKHFPTIPLLIAHSLLFNK